MRVEGQTLSVRNGKKTWCPTHVMNAANGTCHRLIDKLLRLIVIHVIRNYMKLKKMLNEEQKYGVRKEELICQYINARTMKGGI